MKVLIAPQEFKGTLTAVAAAQAISKGITRAQPDAVVDLMPLADGGGGTVDAFLASGAGVERFTEVRGPLGAPVRAKWARFGNTAVMEMASASGLLLSDERSPLEANTYGTGQLIAAALEAGCTRLMLGCGGSATTDAGAGALCALGLRLLDEKGRELAPAPRNFEQLARIDPSQLPVMNLELLTDVRSPLLGPLGTATVFAPQKGADPATCARLEALLTRFASIVGDRGDEPGAGAAGGLAYGLSVLACGKITSGFEAISKALRMEDHLAAADLVITGEGRIDAQTELSKGPWALAQMARRRGKKIVAFAGQATPSPAFDEIVTAPGDASTAAEALEEAAFRWSLRQRE